MDKFTYMAVLLDIYGGLLTAKQREVMELYYNYDLSLSEIAEQYEISRQGVHDLIRRGEQTLNGAEEKIGIVKRRAAMDGVIMEIIEDIDKMIRDFDKQSEKFPEDIKMQIGSWKDRLMILLNG